MPRFSVIIPTRDRRRLLQRTLASVAAQTHPADEVIVVDSESTDGTGDDLAALAAPVRSLRIRTNSPGAARNAGAGLATGDYLAFLDSDDVWMPWAIDVFSRVAEQYHQPALIAASFRQFTDERELDDEQPGELAAEATLDYLSSWPRQAVVGAGMMVVRRDAFERVGGFSEDPVNLEDHDLMLRLGAEPGFVRVSVPLILGWRQHAGSVTRNLSRSVAGCVMLLAAERRGAYPGGDEHRPVRRGIITMHARSVSIECARAGRIGDAVRIYVDTLAWHLALRRWKYLITFPCLVLAAALRSTTARGVLC